MSKLVELTIEITNHCEHGCMFCSSCAREDGKHLGVDTIKDFLLSYRGQTIDRINISGGEPLAHPQFYRILFMCEAVCKNVHIYSNAIKNLHFNAHVLDEVNVVGEVVLVPDMKVHIPKGSFKVNVLKFVSQGDGEKIEEVDCTVSSNLKNQCRGIKCDNPTLRADGKVVKSPCKKWCD